MLQRLSCGLEVKLAPNSTDERQIEGYGSVFGNIDSYGDIVEPGAFAETLAQTKRSGEWPALLLQHGGMLGSAEDLTPIGIITDLAEDGKGLWMQAQLADTTRGTDVYKLLKMKPRPAIRGLSIGYHAQEWTVGSKADEPRRRLKKVDLLEISLVTFPANPKARVQSIKSIEELNLISEFEQYLRDAGFSRQQAVAFVSRFKSCLRPRDSESARTTELTQWLAQHPLNQRT
jgi:HK97 family phage prohead protease